MGRVVPAEGLEVCATYISDGHWVGMNAAVIQYDKTVFCQDADQSRPSRRLQENAGSMDKHMPTFGACTRGCIGKNISLSELHRLVPDLLRNFELELVEKHKDWKTLDLWFAKQDFGLVLLRKRDVYMISRGVGRMGGTEQVAGSRLQALRAAGDRTRILVINLK